MINIDIRGKTYLLIPADGSHDVRKIVDRIEGGQALAESVRVFALRQVAEGASGEGKGLAKLEYAFLYRNTAGRAQPHINVAPCSMDVRLQGLLNYAPANFQSVDSLLIDDGQAILLEKQAVEDLVRKYFL
ncbi:hypothetical protein KY310_01105 [Candidatus Woesearchaeota archaeon]|nr:hypothetical protein [Candidatus Woesearchaeota archaeon]